MHHVRNTVPVFDETAAADVRNIRITADRQVYSAGFLYARVSNVMAAEAAAKAGADRVELYTEPYATNYPKNPEAAIAPFIEAAKTARKLGIGLNAGHDLSLVNLNYFYKNIPWVDEVSIGHALISDALYLGLERTIQEYKNCLRS